MSNCPDSTVLRRLEAGEMPDEQADAIIAHVEQCSTCHESMERIRNESLDGRILRRAMRDEHHSAGDTASSTDDTTPVAAESTSGIKWDIPDYERVRLCGEGAFGTVWAVRDRVGVYRALKTIDLSRIDSANAHCRELTALEAYCCLVDPHPNLINVFHVGIRDKTLYYTMELADDGRSRKPIRQELPEKYRPMTLQQVMMGRPISANASMEVVTRLLRGLAHLHNVGLAHRDIKPANIVFVDRQPKLSDLGMITTNTATPSNVGTPDYMPPDNVMDTTADTFAMGRVLFEMLVGSDQSGFPNLGFRILRNADEWNIDRIQAVLDRACASTAADRYQNADAMLADVESCREWALDSLFKDVADRPATTAVKRNPYVPLGVAAINALPWVLGLILAIVMVSKLL